MPGKETKAYYLKNELINNESSKFFTDFDIFERKGLNEILGDTLRTPFFQLYPSSDSLYQLILFTHSEKEEFVVPKGNILIYTFHDIYDGPRHIYSKIERNEIIRYGYSENPYKYDKVLVPERIEVIKQDTFYNFSSDCLDTTGIKGKVLPFSGVIISNCEECLVQYFSKDTTNEKLYHYYRHIPRTEELSKKKPGDGIYGFKRRFRYWRDFHDLKRMI